MHNAVGIPQTSKCTCRANCGKLGNFFWNVSEKTTNSFRVLSVCNRDKGVYQESEQRRKNDEKEEASFHPLGRPDSTGTFIVELIYDRSD